MSRRTLPLRILWDVYQFGQLAAGRDASTCSAVSVVIPPFQDSPFRCANFTHPSRPAPVRSRA